MKILVISPKNKTTFNFRGDLIRDMINSGHEVYATGPNKDFIEDVMALGIKKFYEVPFVKDNTNPFGDISYEKRLKDVIKEVGPDMTFAYTIKPVVYGSIAARAAGVDKIYAMVTGLGRAYSSGGIKTKAIKEATKILYKKAFKGCNRVLFQNSDDIEQFVSGGYLPREKTALVNGSGVNMERFAKSDIPEAPVFLMVSRIIREKGVLDYLEAARKMKAALEERGRPGARCILLGGFDSSIGALKPEDIQPYVDDGSIELPGEVKDPVEFYQKASVFVLPSYYREGLPRTILEGMSSGRPIITTDWPGCREAIEDGVNGFLVPIKDPDALAKKMITLATDYELTKKMGNSAYEICKDKYEVSVVNKQMKEYLEY